MHNLWHCIKRERIKKDDFIAVIEIAKGSKKKYELDKESGAIILDRILYTSTHYPANYGFIPRTLSEDHDPLDVLIICSDSLDPLVEVRCYPIGVIRMMDQGLIDEKIVAIPFADPNFNNFKDITDLPTHVFDEIKHFFSVYKTLEGKDTLVDEVQGREKAMEVIEHCISLYNQKYGEKDFN